MFAHLGPEALLVALSLLAALVYPELCTRWFTRVEQILAAVARRKSLSVLLCGISALALRLALLPWLAIPRPFINDEFSFLLAGDTFAHGHLANPVPPMWIHFETFHVIFHPTYASMYPPLQGIFLAAGQVIAGHPFWGVWFSVGLMCAAICWMLQGWLPPSWALLGGMLPVMRFGVLSYWDNSYWGGALAATGGALVLGALPRIIRHQRVRDALLMAIGIATLANTRPYEGMMLTLVAGLRLVIWVVRDKPEIGALIRRVAVPAMVVLVISGSATGYYFWRVTGHAFTMPQQVNRDTYAIAKYFYWQKPYPEPAYHHKEISDFYHREYDDFWRARTISSMPQFLMMGARIWIFYISPTLTIPLCFIGRIIRDRRTRFLVIATTIGFASSAIVVFFNTHYVAPVVCGLVGLLAQGLRHLRLWRFEGRRSGKFLVRAVVVISILMIGVQAHLLSLPPEPGTWEAIAPERAAIIGQLESLAEPQLVLVRYSPSHFCLNEWVYNFSDIDHQKVIWARDMGDGHNEELLRYYRGRRVWLLEADTLPPKLLAYSRTTQPVAAISARRF